MSDPMSERYKLSSEELESLQSNAHSTMTNSFEFVEHSEALDGTDFECFSEIKKVLEKYGKSDRFGVALLHKHFEMEGQEVLVETTDVENRSMSIQPQILDSSNINMIDTQWYLGGSMPLSLVKCRTGWHQ